MSNKIPQEQRFTHHPEKQDHKSDHFFRHVLH